MDFVEVGFSFWEQSGDREPHCYHIVRLAMPLNLVTDLPRATNEAVIFNLAEDGPAQARINQQPGHGRVSVTTMREVLTDLPTTLLIAAVYQTNAFPARFIPLLVAEAVLRRLQLAGHAQFATFPPGTFMNGMLMPPNHILRMALLMNAASDRTATDGTSSTDEDEHVSNAAHEYTDEVSDESVAPPVQSPTSFAVSRGSPSWPQI